MGSLKAVLKGWCQNKFAHPLWRGLWQYFPKLKVIFAVRPPGEPWEGHVSESAPRTTPWEPSTCAPWLLPRTFARRAPSYLSCGDSGLRPCFWEPSARGICPGLAGRQTLGLVAGDA